MNDQKFKNLFEILDSKGIEVNEQQKEAMISRMESIKNYEPRIGVFGKTGVGKSSVCNAVFGEEICSVSDVEACTRDAQDVVINIMSSNSRMKLIDVPGVGENADRDAEYARLYAKLLPELDVVLWILKADDRAYASDESFYKNLIVPHLTQGKPVFFVLNQVDKIMPFREWNMEKHEPGPCQLQNIEKKRQDIAGFFGVPISKIIPISAEENYNLINLVDEIIFALPFEKQITALDGFKKELISDDVADHVSETYERTFADEVKDFCSNVGDALSDVAFYAVEGIWNAGDKVLDGISNTAEKVFDGLSNAIDDHCYLTTAVCMQLGKPDNCYELTQLRWFRDHWLRKQPDGEALVREYYATAPAIVEAINRQKDYNQIYNNLKFQYIEPCLMCIENQKFEECKKLYVDMVMALSEKYL